MENARKDSIYESEKAEMNGEQLDLYQKAMEGLKMIVGWRDADQLIVTCKDKIQDEE